MPTVPVPGVPIFCCGLVVADLIANFAIGGVEVLAVDEDEERSAGVLLLLDF